MTLAEKCEDIWPCGWRMYNDQACAHVLGHLVAVEQALGVGAINSYLQENCIVSTTLRDALTILREQLVHFPPVPAIRELPLEQQAVEILLTQGWESKQRDNRYLTQGRYAIRTNAAACELWTRYTGSTSPILTVLLAQGKVREQLKELLTFPHWKETP